MDVLSDSGLSDSSDRIVVSSAFGRFEATVTEGTVFAGQEIGRVHSSAGPVSVVAPCGGRLISHLASSDDRVRPGDALFHLESH